MLRSVLLISVSSLAQAQTINYFGYTCPMGYHTCANCCDIDKDCHCDQFCPLHPEVWTKGGCAVPKSNKGVVKRGDFVCPSGYKKCKNCCDIEGDCKCNEDCLKSGFPAGFDCALQKGQDQYTSASYNAVCPGGYNECSHSCDLNPDCRQDSRCLARAPKGFMCTMPKRHNADKTKMQGGRLEAFAFEKDYAGRIQTLSFDQAEAKCRQMQGGHLMSIHSNEDYRAMKLAVNRARITQAVFIGGYEKKEGVWAWMDGTIFDKKILNGLKSQDFGNNQNMGGRNKNENQMVYCSDQCVNALMGGRSACPNCEGLHDWGNRQARDTAGIGGFVCRVNGASVGHLIDHRAPGGKPIYVEDGAMVCTGDAAMGTQSCLKKSSGWSNSQITMAGRTGTVHGPWGMDTTTVSRAIRIPRSGTGLCAVSWRSWAIDSRDGEIDQLLINGKAVWRQRAQMAFRVQADGNACSRGWLQGPRDFPNPWGGTNAPACYVDRTVSVPCKPNSIMKVTFMSGVDEQKNNEAWAFSDFSVHVRPRPPPPPPRKTNIVNSKCTARNFHQKISYMSNVCCKGKGTKCAHGMPIICRSNCAKAIFRLNTQCKTFIKKQHGMINTMNTAMSRCYHEGRLINKGGNGCTRVKPCTECQGDCDSDADCKGKLTCFQRNQHQRPSGCALGGRGDARGYDYCVDPAILQYKGPRGCTRQRPCLACQGDCDNDAECKGPLKCKQRNGLANIGHGCKGGGRGDAVNQDYCYSPTGMH